MPGPQTLNPSLLFAAFSISLIPLAIVGLALTNSGLGRSRSAAHTMMATLCVVSVAALVYFVCGFAWQGWPGQADLFRIGHWNLMGRGPFFLNGLASQGLNPLLTVLLGMLSVGLAAVIPLGAGAERWRLGAACASAAALAGITFPLFAHWAWAGGWLMQLGEVHGLGVGFLDPGGASVIQAVGGLTALSVVWILGPRRGKYSLEGIPTGIPGHNTILVLGGCFLALVGWLGLNMAGAIVLVNIPLDRIPLVAINTLLAAAAGGLTAAALTRYQFGKPDVSLTANGWVSGLVASSAAVVFVAPAVAAAIGLIAGALVTVAIPWMESFLGIDDPGGSIAVHALGGMWGILAVGLFGRFEVASATPSGATISGQWLAQLIGIATLLGFVFPLTYGLNRLLNRFLPFRVTSEGERQGLDLYELGAGAYPDFVTHAEDFTQR